MKLSEDIRDKLLVNFQNRLVLFWKDKYSEVKAVELSIEDRIDISLKWEDYLNKIGCKIQQWGEAVNQENGVIIRNPSERPEDLYRKEPSINSFV